MSKLNVHAGTEVKLFRLISNEEGKNVTYQGWIEDSFYVYVEKEQLSIFLCKVSEICGNSPAFSIFYNENLGLFRVDLSETFRNYEDVKMEDIFPKNGDQPKKIHKVVSPNNPDRAWLYLAKDAYMAMKNHINYVSLRNGTFKNAEIGKTPQGYIVEAAGEVYWVRR